MSDLKCKFSFFVRDLTDNEVRWIEKYHEIRDNNAELCIMIPEVGSIPTKVFRSTILLGDALPEIFLGPGYTEYASEKIWWIRSNDGSVEHLCDVLMGFLAANRKDSYIIFSWVETCDKLVPYNFVGGSACVYADDIVFNNSARVESELKREAEARLASKPGDKKFDV